MRGFKAGETSIIKQNEKFEVLYTSSGRSVDTGNGLVKSLTATNYDEFYMTAYYAYNDQSAPTTTYAAIWSTRYPIDAMMHKTNVGACGSDNYMWTHANQYDPATEIRGFYTSYFNGYAYPFMYIGVKDRDAQRTTLYHDGTSAIRTDITLSDSIFNYDELILTFATGAYQSNNHATASAYPVSTIQVGKQLCGFNDANGSYFRYEVTSATQLTLISYQDFYLVDVQGIKNNSMEETVIFTNSSSSSVPATVTLSQTYKNFDEICLVGHTADAQFEDMIVTQYYPVKALTKEFDIPVNKRISLFLDVKNCWLSIHGDTTLVPDTTSPTIILDKIIGIKKPFLTTAHELIGVEPLSVTTNGTYTAPSGKAYSPVKVDVYEKYNTLYWGNFASIADNRFFEDARTYDELWLIGYNIKFISGINKLCLWGSRYPVDAVYEFANKRFCMQGSDNYSWVVMNSDGCSATPIDQYGSCTPLAYIGVKNNEREQTLLWKNSETTTPDTITLSDSIFDYDEICLQFINSGSGQYNTAVWFSTSQLSINDTVYGYNDYNGYISKYTITAGDTLSKISEAGYRLYAIYGVNDSSMQETVLFTNPSDSTMPETVTLSDAYTNYDEIALIGHAINDGIKGSQYYPVKVIATGSSMQNMHSRVGIFTDTTNCWLEFTSDTTLVPDANYGMIVDKIIGIKRPVI